MANTAPSSPCRGLSTLAEADAAAKSFAKQMLFTSTGTARTFTLNPSEILENSRLNEQRRLELEDKVEGEAEEEDEEDEQADESL